ncbi:hypothetical protein DHEL01_v206523 [Diaporthe helianthi]|uniref:Uncharacterized protein n=1 Tax=Diaporthe helianthi TaxID=158607 RepID=A0A2P5HXV2_DIAHE|nr:hypothetical protein DHEL01_v206523 [Diaporthe helianthi]
MATIPSNISARARDVFLRASTSSGRQRFSTSRVSRAGSGSFFNLGGLGASREAEYLSRERGIPRTEYNSNIHLIRSSEVDPFAPAPGSSRSAAAAAAARAEAAQAYYAGPGHNEMGRVIRLDDHWQVRALQGEIARLKAERASLRLARGTHEEEESSSSSSSSSMTSKLLSTVIILTAAYFIAKDVSTWFAGSPKPADGPIQHAPHTLTTDEVDEALAQRQRDAPPEERVLAESGMTSFEKQPEMVEPPRRSVLSGLFWAKP